jgi:hypothetical protein
MASEINNKLEFVRRKLYSDLVFIWVWNLVFGS